MTPIDDELRAALHGRASLLAPSPDPLAGIERRAKQIRRNRIGASVAASALAVSAIAVAVPALQSATSSAPDTPRFATTAPTASPTAAASRFALDPAKPWEYRGDDLSLLGPGTLETIEREYATRRGATDVELTPLFGKVYEPSGKFELYFLADVDGQLRWGISETPGHAGPEFLADEALPDPAYALAAALPGDEVARMVVVAAPGTTLEYGPDDASEFVPMTGLDNGVGITALEGDPATDSYRVLDGGNDEVHRAPAPDLGDGAQPGVAPQAVLDPENPWEVRGDRSLVTDGQLEALGQDWAARHGIEAETEVVPLYVQRYAADAGVEVVYLVRSGDGPWTWGVSALGEGGWAWYAEHEVTEPLAALAATLPGAGGDERLLVVAAPSMGGAFFAPPGDGFQTMEDLAPGVFGAVTRAGSTGVRYQVLDGDGNLDRPAAEGEIPPFQNAG